MSLIGFTARVEERRSYVFVDLQALARAQSQRVLQVHYDEEAISARFCSLNETTTVTLIPLLWSGLCHFSWD